MSRSYFNVNPRYTSGSPAMVDGPTAARVAVQEREAYERELAGTYGEELKKRAETLGLKGIVEHVLREERRDRRDGFMVRDLLTDETYWRPATSGNNEPKCAKASEHRPDLVNLKLSAILLGHENETELGIVVMIPCKLCGALALTRPLNIFWPEERAWSLPGEPS